MTSPVFSKRVSVFSAVSFISVAALSATLLISCSTTPQRGSRLIKAKGKQFSMGMAGVANAPVRKVVLDRDFYIDRAEVSIGLFQSVLGNNPSIFKGDTSLPIENVSWVESAQFCNARSSKEGLVPCYNQTTWVCDRSKNGYRLPTEAEWEFVCRAGSSARYPWGATFDGSRCWYIGNSGKKTHSAGTKKPNGWGVYDMIGNVWEWCDDHYTENPLDTATTKIWSLSPKVLRGGSWSSDSASLGSAVRDGGPIEGKSNGVGFRCVRN